MKCKDCKHYNGETMPPRRAVYGNSGTDSCHNSMLQQIIFPDKRKRKNGEQDREEVMRWKQENSRYCGCFSLYISYFYGIECKLLQILFSQIATYSGLSSNPI